MSKKVDITKRTLEQEKQDFIKICKCFGILTNVIRILMAVCVVLLVLFAILGATGVSELSYEFTTKEGIVSTLSVCAVCIGYVIALNFGVSIFRTLRNGETPFRFDIADKIKGAGYALVVTGAVGFLLNVLVQFLVASGDLFFGNMQYLPDTVPFFFGVMLIALAYVFNYGCKLQQESDETL